MEGLILSGNIAEVPDKTAIESKLADLQDTTVAQSQILEELHGILKSISRAQHLLCMDFERILDVPLVYEKVQQDLYGIHEQFDKVIIERIKQHQKSEAWTDIGLSAAGLALFVGGLIVSLAGGPAGVIVFLEVLGTGLSGIYSIRSIDKASVLSTLANVSVERGRGLVTLQAARDAQFWAVVDSIMFGIDGLTAVSSIVKARQASAIKRLSGGAEEFRESIEMGQRLDFEQIFEMAAPRGVLPMNQSELSRLQSLGSTITDRQAAGRIAEELIERTSLASGDYISLATRFRGNQGIDFVFVKREIFENILGNVAESSEARRLLSQASDEQIQRLAQELRRSSHPDDIVSIEVKFSRTGESVEELLGRARGGVQQNQIWYRNLLSAMREARNPEIVSTGHLLERIVGTEAQYLERLSRVGIKVDPNGRFVLTPLTDDIINNAYRIKSICNSKRYRQTFHHALRNAERSGNQAAAQRYRSILEAMNREMEMLDRAVLLAKQAHRASRTVQQSFQRAVNPLADINRTLDAPPTPSVRMMLHTTNSLARTYLGLADQKMKEAEVELESANQIIKRNLEFQSDIEKLKEQFDRNVPDSEIQSIFRALKDKYPELFD